MDNQCSPLYFKVLDAYKKENHSYFKKYRIHKSLTVSEKKIFQARHYINNRKWAEAYKVLAGMDLPKTDFLKAEYYIIFSFVAEYSDELNQAIKKIRLAIQHYHLAEYKPGLFIAYFNLASMLTKKNKYEEFYCNLCLAEMYVQSDTDKALIFQSKAESFAQKGDWHSALKTLNRGKRLLNNLNMANRTLYLCAMKEILFQGEFYKQSFKIINQLKGNKFQVNRAEIIFHWHLSQYIQYGKILKTMPKSVSNSKLFSLQWEIIKCAQLGLLMQLKKKWLQLVLLMPDFYLPNFKTASDLEGRGIFMFSLQRVFDQNKCKHASINYRFKEGSKFEKLFNVLNGSLISLSRENLIELIWGQPYSPVFDSRFGSLVYRFNRLGSGVKVICKNRSYSLLFDSK